MYDVTMYDRCITWLVVWITLSALVVLPLVALSPISRGGAIKNILYGNEVTTVPEVGTCGSPGSGNEFILDSIFEFGAASPLFRGGQVLHCAYDCTRKLPRPPGSYVQLFSGDTWVVLGAPGCSKEDEDGTLSTDNCFVDIDVTPSHSATYVLWLKPAASSSGIILDAGILQVKLSTGAEGESGDLALLVGEPRSQLASIHVTNPANRWIHLAIQENLRGVASGVMLSQATYTVFIDGVPVTAWVDLPPSAGATGSTLRIGASQGGDGDSISAEYRDVRRYSMVITDREIQEIRTGTFPEVRPLSNCLCDEDHPHLEYNTSTLHCWANGNGVNPRSRRLDPGTDDPSIMFFLPDFVVDNKGQYIYDLPMFWVSSPGLQEVALQMDLSQPAEVSRVSIMLVSHPPEGAIVIEKRQGEMWSPWHYIAFDCTLLGFTSGYIKDLKLWMPEPFGAACHNITKFWQEGWDTSSTGMVHPPVITWDVTSGRPGQVASWRHGNLTQFLQTDGIRVRFKGHPRGAGSDVRRQVHAVAEVEAIGRSLDDSQGPASCECFPGTSTESVCGERGQCACMPEEGDISRAGPQCVPYVTRIEPSYGPMAGGAQVYLYGGYLGTSIESSITVGQSDCRLRSINNTIIWCETSPVTNPIPAVTTNLAVNIALSRPEFGGDTYSFQIAPQFTYKPDPIITAINPLETFIRGGVTLTVHGHNLNSVAYPKFQVIMTYRARNYPQPQADCLHQDESRLLCTTPYINLPTEYTDLDVIELAVEAPGNQRARRGISSNARGQPARSKRDADGVMTYSASSDGMISNNNLQLAPSFHLDGVVLYRDLTFSLPQYSTLLLYSNPILFDLEEMPWKFSPNNGDSITFKGQHLDGGCQMDDYRVSIGEEACIVIQLTTTTLVCQPPATPPAVTSPPGESWEASPVTVEVGRIRRHVGYVQYAPATLWDNAAVRSGCITALCVLVIVPLLVCFIYLNKKRKWIECPCGQTKSPQQPENVPLRDLTEGRGENAYTSAPMLDRNGRHSILQLLDSELEASILECLIESSRLDLIKEVGKGHFGRVYAGVLRAEEEAGKPQLVAIKTLKDEAFQPSAISEFLCEATIMKDFDHVNVLRLIGVVIEARVVYVVLPFMENGDVRTFIAKPEQMLTVRELLDFGMQAARGLAYLEQHKFVHRDVAARNCMVDSEKCIKIADFGLARDMYEKDYYRPEDLTRPLPVKWTALECLDGAEFTTKSDVWSYGVLLWEILTRGRKPFNDVSNFDMKRYLVTGRRLESPEFCPTKVYELMQSCWVVDPNKRPAFHEIASVLYSVLHPLPAPPESNTDKCRNDVPPEGLPHGSPRPESRLSAVPDATPTGERNSYSASGGSITGSPVAQRAIHDASGYSPTPRRTPYKSVTSPLVHDPQPHTLPDSSTVVPSVDGSRRAADNLAKDDRPIKSNNNIYDTATVYENTHQNEVIYEPSRIVPAPGGYSTASAT